MILPPWAYAAAAGMALTASFGAGWYVESLRWSASLLKAERGAVKQERRQQVHVEKEATSYETERTNGTVQQQAREVQIRTIFKDRVVPADCAAPDAVVRVLDEAVASANSLATGEPRDKLPDAARAPEAADRPRPFSMGSRDDSPLWGLRIETSSRDPSLAEITPAFAHPSPTRDEPGNAPTR